MRHEDEQANDSLPQSGHRGPDRSQAWMQLTYDYLQSLFGQLDDVLDLLQAQDNVGIRQIAHRAKGTAGTYGLRPIAERFAQLEETTEADLHEGIPRLVATIRQLIEVEVERLRPRVAPSAGDPRGETDG